MQINKKLIILILMSIFSINSWGLTPQKYCETLAATSCEVLNIDISAGKIPPATSSYTSESLVTIKYCRDQIFKFKIYGLKQEATGSTFLVMSDSSNFHTLEVRHSTSTKSVDVEFTSPALCAADITLTAVKKVLP